MDEPVDPVRKTLRVRMGHVCTNPPAGDRLFAPFVGLTPPLCPSPPPHFTVLRHEVLLWMPERFWRVTTIIDLLPSPPPCPPPRGGGGVTG